jgi:hypothetical protein
MSNNETALALIIDKISYLRENGVSRIKCRDIEVEILPLLPGQVLSELADTEPAPASETAEPFDSICKRIMNNKYAAVEMEVDDD